ncbi:hypothetical protein SO802_029016 [Lithocarpus litseifolius]|uniref:SCP domain-containing protein n=1 Tax=Lithocarpus litseifolius TaxID=425828 RepID=A0AAW2BU45_9ROSI
MWVAEKPKYDYNSNSCVGGECHHYTQVVWSNSVRLGCAKVRCNNGATIISCNYDPPGNYVNQRPYLRVIQEPLGIYLDRTGVGAIIQNEQGQVTATMTATGPKLSSSEEAELLACRRSMEFAVDVGFTKLIIEGDNVNVTQAISSLRINCSLLGYVGDDIRHLVDCLEWARISITRRGGNKVALALAQYARNSLDNDVYWMEDSPHLAVEALIQDVLLL